MRTVFSNDMVAHLWANQSQHEARNANSSIWFEGDTIYSYGRHFPIARWITNNEGERLCLFNDKSYSVTTAKHIGRVHRALGYRNVTYVDDPTGSFDGNLAEANRKLTGLKGKAERAKTRKGDYLFEALKTMEGFNHWADFIGIERPFDCSDVTLALWKAEEDDAERRAREAERRIEQRRLAEEAEKERRAQQQENLERWIKGENVSLSMLPYNGPISVRAKGDTLETSWGAECPLKDAVAIFRLAMACRAAGKAYRPELEIAAGAFRLDWINSQGDIRVGCHLIHYEEAERLAGELGLTERLSAA